MDERVETRPTIRTNPDDCAIGEAVAGETVPEWAEMAVLPQQHLHSEASLDTTGLPRFVITHTQWTFEAERPEGREGPLVWRRIS